MIEVKDLLELVIVVLTIKLIVSRYQPPVQESLQAIICIVLGTVIGLFMNPTLDGFITAVIASGFAFYGGDLFTEFRTVKNEVKDSKR